MKCWYENVLNFSLGKIRTALRTLYHQYAEICIVKNIRTTLLSSPRAFLAIILQKLKRSYKKKSVNVQAKFSHTRPVTHIPPHTHFNSWVEQLMSYLSSLLDTNVLFQVGDHIVTVYVTRTKNDLFY